jgi:murein DD-endopeptidase MepM/ murein hydrolase activator NlpD
MRAAAFALAALFVPAAVAAAPHVTLDGEPAQGGLVRGTAPAGTISMTLDGEIVPLAPDGRFLLGFDRDAGPRAQLDLRNADGTDTTRMLTVAPRSWRIEHVGLARRRGGPTPEYRRLRAAERARIDAARSERVASDGWRQRFTWPARGRISGHFGSQRIYRGGVAAAYHSGTDIAAGAGAPVVAPADGVVTLAPPPAFSLEGNLVIVNHGMGLNSAFLHLSRVVVHTGQVVRQGQAIGFVGATGRATGPHLHWSVMWNDARVDPERLMAPDSR